MSTNLLTLEGVHTHIGAYHILHGVDLVVPRGQLTLLLGRNGAGKTTTLRTIMGLWQASQGRITFGGEDITALNTPAIAQKNIAYVPENMGIFSDLTVKENMLLAARSAKSAAQMDEARLQWIFKLFPAVQKFWNHPAGKLSGGQKQMLAVSRAIVEPRDLLIGPAQQVDDFNRFAVGTQCITHGQKHDRSKRRCQQPDQGHSQQAQ